MQRALPFAGVYLVLFLIGAETFLVSPLLPTIADDLREREAVVATTVTAYTLAYALSAPFLSPVFDAYPRRTAIGVGTVLFLVGNVLAAVAGGIVVLVGARVVGALGAAIAGPAIWAHLSERAPSDAQGRTIGLGLAAFSAGTALGVPAASLAAGDRRLARLVRRPGGRAGGRAPARLGPGAARSQARRCGRRTDGPARSPSGATPRCAPRWPSSSCSRAPTSAPTPSSAPSSTTTSTSRSPRSASSACSSASAARRARSSPAGSATARAASARGWRSGARCSRVGVVVAVWARVLPVAALAVLVWFFASGAFTGDRPDAARLGPPRPRRDLQLLEHRAALRGRRGRRRDHPGAAGPRRRGHARRRRPRARRRGARPQPAAGHDVGALAEARS